MTTPPPVVGCYPLGHFTDAELNTALSGQGSSMAFQVLGGRPCPREEPQSLDDDDC